MKNQKNLMSSNNLQSKGIIKLRLPKSKTSSDEFVCSADPLKDKIFAAGFLFSQLLEQFRKFGIIGSRCSSDLKYILNDYINLENNISSDLGNTQDFFADDYYD